MKRVFLHSFAFSLLTISSILNGAEAPAILAETCRLGKTNLVFTTGVKISEPTSSWVTAEHIGNLTLGTPAAPALTPAGGLNGFVHNEAGPELAIACAEKLLSNDGNPYDIGTAILTPSFNLGAKGIKHIVHVAATRREYYPDNKAEQENRLESCYRNLCMTTHAAQSPAILSVLFGTGVGGYTIQDSASSLAKTVHSLQTTDTVESVYIVCPKAEDVHSAVAAVRAFQLSSDLSAMHVAQ